jgi:hypothetical protein
MLQAIHNHTVAPHTIEQAIDNLRQVIAHRMQVHFDGHPMPLQNYIASQFPNGLGLPGIAEKLPQPPTDEEWIVILLALVPHLQPNFFEAIIGAHLPTGGDFAEFGGVRGGNHRSLLPTGETVQFVLAGNDMAQRLAVHQYFAEEHFFFKHGILWLEPVKEGEPHMSGRIIMAQDWVDKLLLNKESAPRFGIDFPAKKITTHMHWNDVVLAPQTQQQINDLGVWLQHNERAQADGNLGRKIKPGYRVLFYGPSGTGKTLTTALLGKQFDKEVYRIDLSQIVSKYIGETEKNLETVFRKAETKDWILFFDEADALFGKRTNVGSSHDKYANQEVSYLLQRVEDYPGLLILASNFKNNLDDAFLRRFHALVHFPMPVAAERLLLWQKAMPANLPLAPSVNLDVLAKKYDMSGASILNAVHYAALQCYARKTDSIGQDDLLAGIKKEYYKEEKSFA